jgi:predicted TIM-barrel fold metal-dependent hydrolase
MSTDNLISADSHVTEDPQLWVRGLPARFKDRAPVFPERVARAGFEAKEGGWDPRARVGEMSVDGVIAEVLYPSLTMDLFGLTDPELQEACFRVYNDWIMEYCRVAPDRLAGLGCISTFDIDHAVLELQRCKQGGLRGVVVWQTPPDELAFSTDHYERLWSVAEETELPVSMHILTGARFTFPRPAPSRVAHQFFRGAVNTKLLDASNAVSDLIAGGALERHPRLKFVLVENEISWLPFYLNQYDKYWARGFLQSSMTMPPSAYFERQFYATFFNDAPSRWILSEWGTDNCMWSNDFPHPNSTWPNSRKIIERDLGHLPEQTRAKLVRENVVGLYKLPVPLPTVALTT